MPSSNTFNTTRSIQGYTSRAAEYENSWHPAHAASFVQISAPQPGEHVLDLACGTGLIALNAARFIGTHGSVTGIDVTTAMLDIARGQLAVGGGKGEEKGGGGDGPEIRFLEGDITRLDEGAVREELGLRREGYDLVTCASALPLMRDPVAVVRAWRGLLREGGKLVVDVPSEQSQIPGLVFEGLVKKLGKEEALPYGREWITGKETLGELLRGVGLKGVEVQVIGSFGSAKEYEVEDEGALGRLWDGWAGNIMSAGLGFMGTDEGVRGRELFMEGMRLRAINGVVKEDGDFYIAVGYRG